MKFKLIKENNLYWFQHSKYWASPVLEDGPFCGRMLSQLTDGFLNTPWVKSPVIALCEQPAFPNWKQVSLKYICNQVQTSQGMAVVFDGTVGNILY